jgi:hypothetical protein
MAISTARPSQGSTVSGPAFGTIRTAAQLGLSSLSWSRTALIPVRPCLRDARVRVPGRRLPGGVIASGEGGGRRARVAWHHCFPYAAVEPTRCFPPEPPSLKISKITGAQFIVVSRYQLRQAHTPGRSCSPIHRVARVS